MAFDGGFLYKILDEIRSAEDSHIDKIYQPSKDELVFFLRKKGFAKRLYITVKPGNARVQFTENKFDNPTTPPNFCMVLRKYLSSARLVCVTQKSLERVAEFEFSAINEMGDTEVYRLICEFIGNQANVILLRENGRIVDSLKRSDVESAKRLILPGAEYEYPTSTGKLDPFGKEIEDEISGLNGKDGIAQRILESAEGFSPLVCREIAYRSEKNDVLTAFRSVTDDLFGKGDPVIVTDRDNNPLEYSYTDISQYKGYNVRHFECCSELLDAFYSEKENAARISRELKDITRLVKNLYSRTEKRMGLRLTELKKCSNRETLRIYGELLKANLYRVSPGDRVVKVENYYDENCGLIEIPLDPALTPSKNADKYFKEYKKTYSAQQALTLLIENDKEELKYFDTVLDSITRCSTVQQAREIREELIIAGYVKKAVQKQRNAVKKTIFEEHISSEGYKILVGKNNVQNDELTVRTASKTDLWFHTKDIPGSHVVIFCEGQPVSKETVMQAARLAAYNSKASGSSNVPVDYTFIKNVKKPSKAKPGMVIYSNNKTVYVTPDKEEGK